MKKYDYIITGAGCAGLSLLTRILQEPALAGRTILLVDKAPRSGDDRTWCFWEKEPGLFEPVVYRQWQHLLFHGKDFSRRLDIAPYSYKMIRGADFHTHCHAIIARHPQVEIMYGLVEAITNTAGGVLVTIDGHAIEAAWLFNSVLFNHPQATGYHHLLQHFKGLVIETPEPAFDSSTATLMDFRVPQDAGASFVYTMPLADNRALVEYTVFSPTLLPQEEYDRALHNYLRRFLDVSTYRVTSVETGVIPMTNYPFPAAEGNIMHIGTAGGQTRASSGYTFRFIQERTAAITQALVSTGKPFTKKGLPSRKSKFYDSVLLHILSGKKLEGEYIFSRLFRKNAAERIFRFLDDESTLVNDLSVISSLPIQPFLRAAIAEAGPRIG
ncbi:MAG: lycopene cyclase [Bacteroidetes bacterium]|nr:lycopene cyclase [Bacteroidota bacterium]